MRGQPAAAPLLELASQAEALGYDSVWLGDSLLARPRHEPLTLLAAIAGQTRHVELGAAVLLPALRNLVLLAHQAATLDQISCGRLILGCGIAADLPNVRDEFLAAGVPWEKRVGRMLEGLRLCRALWRGAAVDWAGRWTVTSGILGPALHRAGGPPIGLGGAASQNIRRVGREFDGWFPNSPDPDEIGQTLQAMRDMAVETGRADDSVTCAVYLTIAIDDDAHRASSRIDDFLGAYYGAPPAIMRKIQACYAGSPGGATDYVAAFAAAGASHVVLRFAGDHERHLELMATLKDRLG